MVLLCAKAFDMKKTAIILTAFIGCMFAEYQGEEIITRGI
jgi:hypothetical protein